MANRTAKKYQQRIRELEKALQAAQASTSLVPVPSREVAAATMQRAHALEAIHPVYHSVIPRLDSYQTPDLHGGYQKGRLWSSYGGGVSFELLRLTAKRCLLLQAIHACCHQEMQELAAPARTPHELGHRIEHADAWDEQLDTDTPEMRARCARVQRIFAMPHAVHEPTFSGFLSKALNDFLTINRVVIELIRDRRGRIVQFRCVDGATILPTFRVIQRFVEQRPDLDPRRPEAYEVGARLLDQVTGHPISESEYVCVMHGELVGTFAHGELLVWEYALTADIRDIFPPSYVEKALEGIVSWMNAFSYNRNYFTIGNPIEVILGVSGEMEDDSFVTLQETLRGNFSGLKGAWRVPLVQLPSQETLQVIKLKENHKDMQFEEWMSSLVSLVCAIYRKDPARIYLAAKSHGSGALFKSGPSAEVATSQEEGFELNRAFFGASLTRLVQLMDPALVFTWSGLDVEDRDAELRIDTTEMQTFRSMDEIRLRRGEEPFAQPWSQVPLHPLVFQAVGLTSGRASVVGDAESNATQEDSAEDAGEDVTEENEEDASLAKAQGWAEVRL